MVSFHFNRKLEIISYKRCQIYENRDAKLLLMSEILHFQLFLVNRERVKHGQIISIL